MQESTKIQPISRKKSLLWKWTFWLLGMMLIMQLAWLTSVRAFREILKIERATPRVSWFEWPSEIDIQIAPRKERVNKLSNGPHLTQPQVQKLSIGSQLASMCVKSKICIPDMQRMFEPWNIKIQMGVILSEDERFICSARGSIRPEYEKKKLSWNNDERCEPVRIVCDFLLPDGKKFYGYILRLFYKDRMTSEFAEPPILASIMPASSVRD